MTSRTFLLSLLVASLALASLAEAAAVPEDRLANFLTCVQTCQAANFAATTSCTCPSGTYTCAQIFPFGSLIFGRSLQPAKALVPAETPLERGFFNNIRFACYSTCQAGSFASTTSCTVRGLIWSTTLTCAQIFPLLAANQG